MKANRCLRPRETETTPFPVMGFGQLPAAFTKREVFEAIRAAGINVFMTASDPKTIHKQLDLAQKAGIRALICDPRLAPSVGARATAARKAAVAEYREHPATFGFYVKDEPLASQFPEVAQAIQALREEAPEKVAYVNSFGCGQWGAASFFEYAETFARDLRPAFLSFDAYPISRIPPRASWSQFYEADRGYEVPELGAYYRDSYAEAWETFWLMGWKYRLPLWGFVLATPHQHSIWFYGPVTESTMRLEAFTGLAYGAHATQYFTLPTFSFPGWQSGLLDSEGRPTPRLDACRQINRDLAVLGPIVREMTSTGVYYTGLFTSGCRRFAAVARPAGLLSSHQPVAGFEGDPVLAGFLKDARGEGHVMLVNRSPARAARVRLALEMGWAVDEVLKTTGARYPMRRVPVEVDLEPGDGRLFRFRRIAAAEEGKIAPKRKRIGMRG